MQEYLRTMIQQVDSSLLDEWERMRDPNFQPRAEQKEARPPGAEEAARDITRDTKAFTAAIRTRIFSFMRGLVNRDYEQALSHLHSRQKPDGSLWSAEALANRMEAYYAEHQPIRLDPEARNIRHTYVTPAEDKRSWNVQQVLVDAEGHNDWMTEFIVDLAASRAANEPVLQLIQIGAIGR
jgi:hypothetical protein